jgi:cytochrome c oxidase subunit 3
MASETQAVRPHAHQFDDAGQQAETANFGMWVFLITEMMFFGGLFAGYIIYRTAYPAAFNIASHETEVLLGGTNTVVLICSSLTMALAVRSAQLTKTRQLAGFLTATILLGLIFMGIKGVEYYHKAEHHLVPGASFQFEGPHARGVELFMSFYFAMTGLHALHMVIGVGILGTLLLMALRGRFSAAYYTPVELSGLYWHFVDIIWIFLYPLLYLLGRHIHV